MSDTKEILDQRLIDALWLRYLDAFAPPTSAYVRKGFVADLATATPAEDVAEQAWLKLLHLAFKTGCNRGVEMGIRLVQQNPHMKECSHPSGMPCGGPDFENRNDEACRNYVCTSCDQIVPATPEVKTAYTTCAVCKAQAAKS